MNWEKLLPCWNNWHWVSKESESGPTMIAHEFINYELESDLNDSYILTEEEIISILDGGGDEADNEPIEEVDNVQISDVVVDRVGFKVAKSSLVTLKQFLEHRPTHVTLFIHNIQTHKKNCILVCTRISLSHYIFVLLLRLDV